MRISFGQILVILTIFILLFGDIQNLKKKLFSILNQLKENFLKKPNNRKKGT